MKTTTTKKKKSKSFKLTKNLFQGPQVTLYSLDTPLVSTVNISYYLLSLAGHKDHDDTDCVPCVKLVIFSFP